MLGLGIVLSLQDLFSRQARNAQREMRSMSTTANTMAGQLNSAVARINTGLGLMAVGGAALAAVAFPIRDAMRFEQETTRVWSIAERAGYSLQQLQQISKNLAMDFLQTPTEQAAALYSTIAAGIEDVGRAERLLRAANISSVGTDSSLDTTLTGYAAMVNAYNIGKYGPEVDFLSASERANLDPTRADSLNRRRMLDRVEQDFTVMSAQVFEAMNVGLFSHQPDMTDLEAMTRQFGKIAPMAAGMGISTAELLGVWSTATLGGQDARRSATGLRQMLMDFIKPTARMEGFATWAEEQGIEIYAGDDGLPNFSRMIRDRGLQGVLSNIRGYVTEDMPGAANALEDPRIRERMDILNQLPEDMPIEESEEAMQLLQDLAGQGVIRIDRALDIFKSVWGLTAAIPLLTTQYDKLQSNIELVSGATDSMNEAFRKMQNVSQYQLELLISRFAALRTVVGLGALPMVLAITKSLNAMLRAILVTADRFPLLIGVVMTSITAFGLLLATIGSLIALSGLFKWIGVRYTLMVTQMRFGTMLLGTTLKGLFWRVTLLTAGITALMAGLRWAWNSDFMGMATTLKTWWDNVSLIWEGLRDLWPSLSEDGIGSISEELAQKLEEAGLWQTFMRISMTLYRLDKAWKGFTKGFSESFSVMAWWLEGFIENQLAPFGQWVETTFGIDKITRFAEWLENLIDPTARNVEQWEQWGKWMGRIIASTLVVSALWIPMRTLIIAVKTVVWALAAAWRGVFVAMGPVGWAILALSIAIPAAIWAWNTDFLGLKTTILGIAEALREGWGSAFTWLSNQLTTLTERFQNATQPIVDRLRDRIADVLPNATDSEGGRRTYQATAQVGGQGLLPAFETMSGVAFGEDSAAQDLLRYRLDHYGAPGSEDGTKISANELRMLIQELNSADEFGGRPIEVTITLDGRVISRSVQSAGETNRRLGDPGSTR